VNSRAVSVVYDFGPAKRDYLIRSVDTGKEFKFQIVDITTRDSDPSRISLVSEITGTPPDRRRGSPACSAGSALIVVVTSPL
jgi:hypothetical protein